MADLFAQYAAARRQLDEEEGRAPVKLQDLLGDGQPRMERTWGEALKDTGYQLAEGAVNIASAPVNLFAPDSDTAQSLRDTGEDLRAEQSMPMQRRVQRAEDAIGEADQDSVISQAAAALKAYGADPALISRLVATNLPSMVPGLGIAKGAQLAARAAGAGAAGAAMAGGAAASGTNAVLNAGGARGEAYEDVKRTLLDQGYSPQEAEQLALDKSVLPAVVGGAAGAISGPTGLERVIVGRGLAAGGGKAAAKAVAAELGGELLEEGAPKVATNYQASEYDDRPLQRDMGRTMVETAIASAPGSVLAGAGAYVNKDERGGAPATAPATPPATPNLGAANAGAAMPSAVSSPSAAGQPATPVAQPPATPSAERDPLHPEGDPLTLDMDTASQRMAELEVMGSTTGLSPEQERERLLLAHRIDELEAQENAYSFADESTHTQAQAAIEPVAGMDPADLPDAGMDAPAPAFDPAEVTAKTWPQFVTQQGYQLEGLRRGTPDWDHLQTQWAAVKTVRAGQDQQGTGATGAPVTEIQNRDRSRPASVVQMNAMAANPDYGRLGISRSPESGAPMVFAEGDQQHAAAALGLQDVAVMSDGQRVPFRYAVMEAADVQPSNFADGAPNPLFDVKHPGTVKALNNGRTAGVRAAYERGTAAGYKDGLMADSASHGIDPAVIASMQAPVLVRMYSEKDNRTNMGAKSQSQALGLSPAEQAATDAALIDPSVLDAFDAGALDGLANADFVRAFMGRLMQAGQDVAGMMDAGGKVSPQGVQRLQAAMVHKAFDDGDLVETMFGSTDNDVKAIGEALKSVAGEWAHMRHMAAAGATNAQTDITANLLQAIRLVQKARRDRSALADLVNQVDMETGTTVDALTVGMLRLLYSGEHLTRARGRDAIAEGLRQYVTAALATSGGADMFGEVVSPTQIVSTLTGLPLPGDNSTQAHTQTQEQANATATADQPGREQDRQATDGGGQPVGGQPAGGSVDAAGAPESGRPADPAGARADEAGGSGQGQDAQAGSGQPDQQSAQGAGENGRGEVAPEPLALESYTEAEATAKQEAEAQAAKAEEDAKAKADKEAKAERDRKDIAARQDASAENFQLGQDPMDSLSGQESFFDAPQNSAPAHTDKAPTANKNVAPEPASDDDLNAMFDELMAEQGLNAEPDSASEAAPEPTAEGYKVGDTVELGKGRVPATILAIEGEHIKTSSPLLGLKKMHVETFRERLQAAKDAQQATATTAPDDWRGTPAKTRAYAKGLIDAGQLDADQASAVWTDHGALLALLDGQTEAKQPEVKAAPASKPAAKPKSKAALKREADAKKLANISEKYLNGAVAGDTITASKDVDYVTGGKPLLIESITPNGEVYVHDPVGGGRTSFQAASAFGRGVKFDVSKQQETIDPTAGQALASAAKNTGDALASAIDGLGALFGGGPGKLGSGLSFDEDTYAKAKPLFAQAVSSMGAAGQDLRAAMRAIIQMVSEKFGTVATRNMQPYIVRYVKDISTNAQATESENAHAPSTDASVERDSAEPAAVPSDAGAVQRPGQPVLQDGAQAPGPAVREGGAGQQNDAGVSVDAAALFGKRSDQQLHRGEPADGPADSTAGADRYEGVPDAGSGGISPEPVSVNSIAAIADGAKPKDQPRSNAARKPLNTQARTYALGSPEHAQSVREAAPQLLPGQVDDVVKAELAFSKPDGHGMLLTNGTGTGKTFSGLGTVRRFVDDGKDNVLVIVPDDKIAADWIESGKVLGLTVSQLGSTKDAGKGVTVATYANVGDNAALLSRQWDLVVPDEAHTLMSNQDGEVTRALQAVRALTYHPDGLWHRQRMLHGDMMDEARTLSEQAQTARGQGTPDEALEKRAAALHSELAAIHEAMKEEFAAAAKDGKRTKMLALSATPFAYDKNIEWAEGYLFSYDEGQSDEAREFRGYNSGGNRDRFFMQHFGYRMRYNKLTRPEAGVDSNVMERQFNTWLRQRGVLSSRQLDVPADYDRRFVLFENAYGRRIDEALSWLSEQSRASDAFRELADLVNKSLDYQTRRYLLEAMKAQEAVKMAREHMALGRKVVVFHDYIKGGGTNPFAISLTGVDSAKRDMVASALAEFNQEFGDLQRANLHLLESPITAFTKAFGDDLLLVNGQVKPKRNVLKAYKTFNDDSTGPRVMLVQSAKDKGWSGHDTTGKHQRVLINLGLPTAPTKASQQEGRIYRTGQVSDAIMRYLNTGTSWERTAFASTIASRAATAENLAMGEQARALQDAFIDAFEESAEWAPGHEGEGKGGKDGDRARNSVISEWDRAKTMYWAQQKKTQKTKAREGADYFATPEPLGMKMVQWGGVVPGDDTLEPSAGHGAIARWMPTTGKRTMVEPSPELRSRLALAGFTDKDRIVASTFEDLDIGNKYDVIAMNPPFGTAGRTAVDHIAKAYRHLREGGRLVALLPRGSTDAKLEAWMYDKEAKADKDGNFAYTKPELHFAGEILLPGSAFGRAGTGVVTRIVVLDKLAKGEEGAQFRRADLSDVADIGEFFDRLENVEMPQRAKQRQHQQDEAKAMRAAAELPAIQRTHTQATASADEVTQSSNAAARAVAPDDGTPKLARAGRPIETYTTRKGKELRGVWLDSKAEAEKYDAYTLQQDGKWFVREKHLAEEVAPPAFKRDSTPAGLTGKALQEATERAERIVRGMSKGWANAGPIQVVSTMQDERVPAAVRAYDQKLKDDGATGEAAAFVYKGVTYLVAGQLRTPQAVAEALAHEVLGHHGLRGAFGEGLTPILKQIAQTRAKDMQRIAKDYGLSLANEADRLQVAEEVLAFMAQETPQLGFVKRALAQVATWLRQHVPGFSAMQMTDAEMIRRFILPARQWVQQGVQQAAQAQRMEPSFMRAPAIESDAFRKWFGGSKVVDVKGKPLVVYHGSQSNDIAEFGPVIDGAGWFAERTEVAELFSGHGPDSTLYPVYLSLQNPLDATTPEGQAKLRELVDFDADATTAQQLERHGYDGLISYENTPDDITFLAFRPEQIKSAIGNNGDFDPATPDIRFLRLSPGQVAQVSKSAISTAAAKVRSLITPSKMDELIYNWQDRFIDLKRIQTRIRELGGTITENTDAYLGEELYHKRVAKRTQNFLRDELQPLLAALNKAGVKVEEFETFLHARHAPEANAAMAERNPDQKTIDAERKTAGDQVRDLRLQLQKAMANGSAIDPIRDALKKAMIEMARWDGAEAFRGTEAERLSLSGMSDQEAANIVNGYGPAQRAVMDRLASMVDAINDKTLHELDGYGLMDKASITAWRAAYKHYIPLHRDEAHPDSKAHPIGQGFSTKGDAAKARTGSNEKVTNILGHIAMQREAALTRGEKNNVAKRLYVMAAQNPDDALWSLKLPKKKVIDQETGLVQTVTDRAAALRDNVLSVRVGGKDQFIIFNEKNENALRLAVAMRNLDATELDRFTRTMGHLTRWFASVNTQYNPIFSIFNFARDVQGSMLQLSTTPLKGKEAEILKGVKATLPAIYFDLRRQRKGQGVGTSQWEQLWEQLQLDGGTTGYRDLYRDPNERTEALKKAIALEADGKSARKGFEWVKGWLSDFNDSFEGTTRLAVYKIALDQGLSRQQSASIAKNITVNFNRRGRNMATVGSYYAFMNAAIQGNVRMMQTLNGPRGRQIMAGGVMLGMLSSFAGYMAMGGGGGADDEWAKIPDFVKERSLIIPFSGKDYFAIPMPLGFHVFPNIGRKLIDVALHDDPTTSRAGHLAELALIAVNAYNPMGGADNFWQMLAPTPIDPVVALMENKDWTGKAIYREQRSGLDPKPGHQMAKDSTTGIAKGIAQGINAATGGNDWQQGYWSPNPDAIEYLFGQFTGGVGRELSKAGNMVQSAITGEELAPHQLTLVGRVYGNTRGVNGQSSAFYDNIKRINVSMAEAKDRVEQGEAADVVLKDVPLAVLDGGAARLEKRVKELVKARQRLQKSDEPDRKDRIEAVNQEIEGAMYRLNAAVAERLKNSATQ